MRYVAPTGEVIIVPDPEAEPTQDLLGTVYDEIDEALDLIECAYLATHGPDILSGAGSALRAVLDAARTKLTIARDNLHPTLVWAK